MYGRNYTSEIMENKMATFIFFMLLMFTVSAARLTVDPPVTNPSAVSTDDASKLAKKTHPSSGESVASSGSNILLPIEKVKSDSNETTVNNQNPEPEKSTNDLTPRTNFSRFHPINRHFLSKPLLGPKQTSTHRRPCRKHAQYRISRPRAGISDRNQQIASSKTDHPIPESFRGEVPSNWLKMKHHYMYSSRGQQNNRRNKNDDELKTKSVFDREKLKNLIRQHKDKKREEEAGSNLNSDLMKSIRKFLKHSFD